MKFQTPFAAVPAGLLDALRGRGRRGAAHLRAVELWIELASMVTWDANAGDGYGVAWPTVATLAERMSCSRDVVHKASAMLQRAGYLQLDSGKATGRRNRWILAFSGPSQAEIPPAVKKRQGCGEKAAGQIKVVNKNHLTRQKQQHALTVHERGAPPSAQKHAAAADSSTVTDHGDGGFDQFAATYPVMGSREAARREWRTLAPDDRAAASAAAGVLAHLYALATNDRRRRTMHAARWLRERRWLDGDAQVERHYNLDGQLEHDRRERRRASQRAAELEAERQYSERAEAYRQELRQERKKQESNA